MPPNGLGVSRVATHQNASGQKYRSTPAAGQRRLHAVLGAACGTRALSANRSPNLQSISRVRIRF
jgi:hypothetical protein